MIGSDESHFNVSVGSDGQSNKTLSTNHDLFEDKGESNGIEPRFFRLPAKLLTARPNKLTREGLKLGWFYTSRSMRGVGENWDGSMLQR